VIAAFGGILRRTEMACTLSECVTLRSLLETVQGCYGMVFSRPARRSSGEVEQPLR
jgi:hypothetical protein